MPVAVILGGHWGDEGKGKVIDLLAGRFEYNVRYSGGANAGHTVVNEYGSFALHQVPSGVFHNGMTAMLAAGVVVDPEALLAEIEELEGRGVDLTRFYISERAHIVLPHHKLLDKAEEERRGDARLGTTGKGIGPAYSDKAARDGVRMGDLLEPSERDRSILRAARAGAARLADLHCSDSVAPEEVVARAARWADVLRPRICDVERHLRSAVARGASVLLEGAQGALLDIDAGSYPFVTSSSTGVAGACASAGIPPRAVDSVVAVLHSYMTRVGAGPFPTELHDEVGRIIQDRGAEFGTTTGRRRRCGWFDALASRYVMEVNGVTSAVLTKLDVLDGLETVKVCVAYELDGKRIEHMPASATVIAKVSPVYEEMPGWPEGSMQARRWEDLHPRAQEYVRRIEELLGVPVSLLSVGPARDQTIQLRDPLAAN